MVHMFAVAVQKCTKSVEQKDLDSENQKAFFS